MSKKAIIKQRSRLPMFLCFATLLVFPACGGKGPLPASDTTPPKVSSTSPAMGTANVPISSSITITFSKAMDPSSINIQTVTLSTGTNNVQGAVTCLGTTVVFTPSGALSPNTSYNVFVSAEVKDLAGNAMGSNYSWNFTTALAPTTISLNAPDVTYGANGNVTVTVSSPGGIPTGFVLLSIDGGAAPVQLLTGGSTAFTIPTLNAGSHTLNAVYAEQGSFQASSASRTLTVNQAATTTNIAAPGITYGANGSVTVTIGSAAGTPSGNVSLSVDSGTPNTQTLSNGSATFTISGPSLGTHALFATYAAQGNFGASSASGTLGVGPGATTMSLNAPGVTYNANGIVTITVSSGGSIPSGNVSLIVDGGTALVQPLLGGSTIFTIPSPSAGSHTLNASYAAQGSFQASSASGTLTVNQAATTTGINAPGITYGANGSVIVTVSSSAGTPSGNVSLSVDSGPTTTLPLDINGSATFTITSPSLGTHALFATYAAQGNFGSSLAFSTLGVGPGATTTNISSPEITYGSNGIVTVTVSSAAGIPSGNVSLSVNGSIAMTQGLINGSATFTITSPNAGSYALSAEYAAQGNFGASSATGALIVDQAATTTIITAPPITYGANGIVTVTVSSAAGTPSGNVSLSFDGGTATTQPLSSGSATFTIPSPNAGTHTLNAAYAAQGNFGASPPASSTLGVGPGATTTIITAPTITYGADGSVTVTVSSTSGTPTGNVALSVDSGPTTTLPLSGGSATFTIPSPSAGTHTLSASYADPLGNFGLSATSNSLIVNRALTSTAITSSSLNPSFGDSVTFTATVTPLTATGTVTFMDSGILLSSGTVTLTSGVASYATSSLGGGSHSITANYSGDTNFTASTSLALLQTVSQATTTTTVLSSSPTSTAGDSVTFTATVFSSTTGTPTGTVTFVDILSGVTTTLGSGDLSGGIATFSTFTLDVGNHSITAQYNGDTNFATSLSSAITQTVN